MDILITNNSQETINGVTYKTVSAICGKKEASITIRSGRMTGINVTVRNAMQKAWRGMGKEFDTIEQAIENYKSTEIKSIIKAAELN